jgi:hypothetical protein
LRAGAGAKQKSGFYFSAFLALVLVFPFAPFSGGFRPAEASQLIVKYPEEAYEFHDAGCVRIVYVTDKTKINISIHNVCSVLSGDGMGTSYTKSIPLPRKQYFFGRGFCDVCVEGDWPIVSLWPRKDISARRDQVSAVASIIDDVEHGPHRVTGNNYYFGDSSNGKFWAMNHSKFMASERYLLQAVLRESPRGPPQGKREGCNKYGCDSGYGVPEDVNDMQRTTPMQDGVISEREGIFWRLVISGVLAGFGIIGYAMLKRRSTD